MTQSGHVTDQTQSRDVRGSRCNVLVAQHLSCLFYLRARRKRAPTQLGDKRAPTQLGDNMTIARIIANKAAVSATIGMLTPAEPAKGKIPSGSFQLEGCAYWMPLCGTVMGSAPNIYVLGPSVPWNTPITVFGQRTGPSSCWGQSTQVAVTGYAPNPKISCQFR